MRPSQVSPQGTTASAYDLAGRRTQLTYLGSGLFVNYDYLVTGETVKIRENGANSGVGVLATYGYDDLGRRTSLIFGNGVMQRFGYDSVSRLASLTNDLAGERPTICRRPSPTTRRRRLRRTSAPAMPMPGPSISTRTRPAPPTDSIS